MTSSAPDSKALSLTAWRDFLSAPANVESASVNVDYLVACLDDLYNELFSPRIQVIVTETGGAGECLKNCNN